MANALQDSGGGKTKKETTQVKALQARTEAAIADVNAKANALQNPSHTAEIEKAKALKAQADANRIVSNTAQIEKQKALEAQQRADAAATKREAEEKAKAKVATTKPANKTVTKDKVDDKVKDTEEPKVDKPKTPAAKTISDLADTLLEYLPEGGDYDYTPFTPIEATLPSLYTAADLAKLYGLDYNQENIYNTLMNGVNTQYQTRYTDQGAAENKFYDNAATAQDTLADTLRQQQSQAIMAGTSKGMQAAQALSVMLGTSQQFAGEATQLSVDRQKLAQEFGAAQAKANADALNTYNAMGADFLEAGKSLYSSDVSKYVGQLDSRASTETANATLAAQAMAGKSAWDTELANSLSGVYGQYMNNSSNEKIANINANTSLGVAGIGAAATRDAANSNYNATKYATDNQQPYNTGYNSNVAQTPVSVFDPGAFVGNVTGGEMDYSAASNYLDGMAASGKVDATTKSALQTWLDNRYGTKKSTTSSNTNNTSNTLAGIIDGKIPVNIYTPQFY